MGTHPFSEVLPWKIHATVCFAEKMRRYLQAEDRASDAVSAVTGVTKQIQRSEKEKHKCRRSNDSSGKRG